MIPARIGSLAIAVTDIAVEGRFQEGARAVREKRRSPFAVR
jgi:hypothetical protein